MNAGADEADPNHPTYVGAAATFYMCVYVFLYIRGAMFLKGKRRQQQQ